MAYKQNAGRGPMQKTGAGIPSALLQGTEVTDEKKGKNSTPAGGEYNSSMSDPVPTKTGDAVTDSYVSTMHSRDVEDAKKSNSYKEKQMTDKKLWPIEGDKFGGGTVTSIDEKGNYNINTGRTSDNIQVSRRSMRYAKLRGGKVKLKPSGKATSYDNFPRGGVQVGSATLDNWEKINKKK